MEGIYFIHFLLHATTESGDLHVYPHEFMVERTANQYSVIKNIKLVSCHLQFHQKRCIFATICGYFRNHVLHFGFSFGSLWWRVLGPEQTTLQIPIFLTNVAFFGSFEDTYDLQ